ncbi:MAG: OmpA family protein [Candidatus Marinarcus sp.]|uniref:OmpA family protein n=1 Tax=Candidatus Marinarcus sp. TaxID=3100987 RepID=UPI003AFFCADA
MSLTKKIQLLTTLLIILIVVCVYQHTREFIPEETLNNDVSALIPEEEAVLSQTQKSEEQAVQDNMQAFTTVQEIAKNSIEEKSLTPSVPPKAVPIKVKESNEALKSVATAKPVEVITPVQTAKPITTAKPVDGVAKNNVKIQEEMNSAVLNNAIVFQRMSSNVTDKSRDVIAKIAKVLKENQDIKIEIAGHTDAKGDEDFNQMVSQQRAESVKNILIEMGVDSQRMVAKGYGETKPIVPNDPDGYSTINRRVEFNIIEE